jgi:hypothetical protein
VNRLAHVPLSGVKRQVDKQGAAPAETRTPNWHRATRSLIKECGWKGGDSSSLGSEKTMSTQKTKRTHLTPTGLLMEGDYTNYWKGASQSAVVGVMVIFFANYRDSPQPIDGPSQPLTMLINTQTSNGARLSQYAV